MILKNDKHVWFKRLSKNKGWQTLLGVHAKPLIEEAYMDAVQGTHFASESQIHPDWKTISKIECACGCKTLLSQKTVDRGWTVIRGHKAAIAGVGRVAPLLGKPREHHPAKVVSNTSMDSIERFIAAELQLISDQLQDSINKRTDLEVFISALVKKKDKLVKARIAIKDIQ